MSVCAARPETPGFFTPCRDCACGEAVRAAQAREVAAEGDAGGDVDPGTTAMSLGRQIGAQRRQRGENQ